MGYSASGKSTLAKILGELFNIPVLHLDKVHFLPNWKERKTEESNMIVENFIKENKNFIIDGNFTKFAYDLRIKLSNKIIFLDFDRRTCLLQAIERYQKYKGTVRESMSEGCYEKLDWDFLHWILIGGRTKERIKKNKILLEKHKDKCIILKNKEEVIEFIKKVKENKSIYI